MREIISLKLAKRLFILVFLLGGLAYVSLVEVNAVQGAREPCCDTCPGAGEIPADHCSNSCSGTNEPCYTGCLNTLRGCKMACDPYCSYGNECGGAVDCLPYYPTNAYDCVNGHCVVL
jgi:hypothetical protein